MFEILKLIGFKTTSKVGKYLYVDGIKRNIKIPRETLWERITKSQIYEFEELVDFDIIAEDGISMSKNPTHSCEIMEVKIILMNCIRYIPLIEKPVKKNSRAYKRAYKKLEEIVSTLQFIRMANDRFVV